MTDSHASTVTLLVVVLAATVLAAAVSTPALAVSEPRDEPQDATPLVVVFVGETLDVSAVEQTGGGTVGPGPVTLVGVGGDAEGHSEAFDDATNVDFEYVRTGTYDTDGDGAAEFTVEEPAVTDLRLRSERGVDVTGDTVDDVETVTVRARYNFAEADRLDVTVRNPKDIEIQNAIADDTQITESNGTVRLDMRAESAGTYRITVEGSELDRASRTVTLTLRERERTPTPTATATPTPASTPTPTPTPAPTPTPTPTPTATATPTPTSTPSATATATPTPTSTPSATATSTPTPTTATTPGFGVLLAAAAIAAFALGSRRR